MNAPPRPRRSPLTGEKALRYVEETLGHGADDLFAFPKYVLLEPVFACNARCVMCGIDFDQQSGVGKRTMEPALFDKIAAELAESRERINKVWLLGRGEPFLDKRLAAKIATLKAGGHWVGIQSNAALMTPEKAEAVIRAGLDEIFITIDSLDPALFESIRVGLDFKSVYDHTRAFIQLRDRFNPNLKIRVQMVRQESNWEEPEAFTAHWAGKLGPGDQIAVQKAHNWAKEVEVVRFGDEAAVNLKPCISLWGTAAIFVDGVVGLCCMDTQPRHPLGDLTTQTMAEIWADEPLARAREIHLAGRRAERAICDGCTTWRDEKREVSEQN